MATKLVRIPTTTTPCTRCLLPRCTRLPPYPAAAAKRLYTNRSNDTRTPAGGSGSSAADAAKQEDLNDKPAGEGHKEPKQTVAATTTTSSEGDDGVDDVKGAMTRRLEEATEEALFTGGTSGRRAIEDAGFSEELKEKLLDKIQSAKFRKQYAGAFATAGLSPSSSSSPDNPSDPSIFSSNEPWSGTESDADAVLRMLNDAKKPLKPGLRGKYQVPNPVDLRIQPKPKLSAGQRAAGAKEKVGLYTNLEVKTKKGRSNGQGEDGDGEESAKDAFKRELRERFSPVGGAPATVSAITKLANERIEDAIARGAFRNIPRGKDAGDRDARADNPFIDTTEYLMNKMIQRQEIVPPWIEKQQELAKAAATFRARLRSDWKRHVARMIASRGGSLEEQLATARGYARAEERVNPRKRRAANAVVSGLSTEQHPVMVKVREGAVEADLAEAAAIAASKEMSLPEEGGAAPVPPAAATTGAESTAEPTASKQEQQQDVITDDRQTSPAIQDETYSRQPFRDSAWEQAEHAYLQLSVDNLNSMARSYNLMAPELAKKPYYSLEREMKACFSDVAPEVAQTIRDRATRPAKSFLQGDGEEAAARGTLFDRFGNDGKLPAARVYENKTPHYGFKEMWKDFWGSDPKT